MGEKKVQLVVSPDTRSRGHINGYNTIFLLVHDRVTTDKRRYITNWIFLQLQTPNGWTSPENTCGRGQAHQFSERCQYNNPDNKTANPSSIEKYTQRMNGSCVDRTQRIHIYRHKESNLVPTTDRENSKILPYKDPSTTCSRP